MRTGVLGQQLLHIRVVAGNGEGVRLDWQEAGDDIEFFGLGSG